jgi:hypothetical protein
MKIFFMVYLLIFCSLINYSLPVSAQEGKELKTIHSKIEKQNENCYLDTSPIPSLARPTGRILNFNENYENENYRLIRQENPLPSRVSNDGYVLWESNPKPLPQRPYKWGDANTTGHAFTNYLPGIEYVLQSPKKSANGTIR